MHTDVRENIHTDVRENMHTDVRENMHTDVRENIHTDVRENMHTDVGVKRVKKRASLLSTTITTIKNLSWYMILLRYYEIIKSH